MKWLVIVVCLGIGAMGVTLSWAQAAHTRVVAVSDNEGQQVQGGQSGCGFYTLQQQYLCLQPQYHPDDPPLALRRFCENFSGWAKGTAGGGGDLLYSIKTCYVCGGLNACGTWNVPADVYAACAK